MKGILNESDLIFIEKSKTFETLNCLQHLIIFEIFNNLPRLEENEKKARDSVTKEKVFRKDKLKDYYEYIKKKYTNFIQLAYVEDEQLDEFYIYQSEFDLLKNKLFIDFDFIKFLQNYNYSSKNNIQNDELDHEKFKNNLFEKFANNYEVVNSHNNWTTLNIDSHFYENKDNEVFMNLIKYNSELNSDSLIVNIKIIHPNILQDLNSILCNRKNINRIIFNLSDKFYMTNENNKLFSYAKDEEYYIDINLVIKVILITLKNFKNLNTICFISNKQIVKLNEENSKDLISIIGNECRIFILKNITITDNLKNEMIRSTINSTCLEYLHLEGINFGRRDLKDIEEKLNKKIIYLGYDKQNVIENIAKRDDLLTIGKK